MSDDVTDDKGLEERRLKRQLRFDYLKSNAFRVIHVDGVWGGIAPSGHLDMVLFSERPPIPKQTVHEFDVEKKKWLENKQERTARDVVGVRELEVSGVMTIDVAKQLRDWLDQMINQWSSIQSKSEELESDVNVEDDEEARDVENVEPE